MSRALNIGAACEGAGISRRTYNETRQKDPAFAQAVDDARLSVIDSVEAAMVTRALGANGHRDGIALLERYDPEWRKRRTRLGPPPHHHRHLRHGIAPRAIVAQPSQCIA